MFEKIDGLMETYSIARLTPIAHSGDFTSRPIIRLEALRQVLSPVRVIHRILQAGPGVAVNVMVPAWGLCASSKTRTRKLQRRTRAPTVPN